METSKMTAEELVDEDEFKAQLARVGWPLEGDYYCSEHKLALDMARWGIEIGRAPLTAEVEMLREENARYRELLGLDIKDVDAEIAKIEKEVGL